MKFDSLAMIETNGLVSALMAINKMTSSGNVEFLKKKIISNGQVILFILGRSLEIKRVLDDGIIAAQKVGVVISSGIVPYPNEIIEKIISDTSDSVVSPKKVLKNIKKVKEKIDILFDQKDDEKSYIDLMVQVAKKSPDIAGDLLSIKHHDHHSDMDEEDTFDSVSSADSNIELEKPIISSKKTSERISELLEEEKKIAESTSEVEESSSSGYEGMSHLERLRAEAKSEIQEEILDREPIAIEENLPPEVETETISEAEKILESKLLKMNVPDLRKLARSIDNFPIKGRDISKANKKLLIEYFKQI